MGYRAGVGAALAKMLRWETPSVPTLTCDVVDCGFRIEVKAGRGGGPPAWLSNRKAPPGWRRYLQPDDTPAQYTCPGCTKALTAWAARKAQA